MLHAHAMPVKEIYLSRVRRDRRYRELRAAGINARRRTSHNQLLHPQYIEDYTDDTGIVLTAGDNEYGNVIYKTAFGALYIVEYVDYVGYRSVKRYGDAMEQ